MTSLGFRKGVAIYFLMIALPCIGLALWGEDFFLSFLKLAQQDDPDDPNSIHKIHLWTGLYELAALLVLGLALIPGYFRQIFYPSTVAVWLWPASSGYNLLVFIAFGGCAYLTGPTVFMDGFIFTGFALAFATPLLGLSLSIICSRCQPLSKK